MSNQTGLRPVSAPSGGRNREFLREIYRKTRLVDLILLASVPAGLVALFSLPQPVKLQLALEYVNPTPLAAFTAHFVHLSAGHLAANLVGYLVLAPQIYIMAILAGRRREFFTAFVTFLVAFPLALSVLNVVIERPRIGYGFSGIVMAFFGLLPILLLDYAGVQFSDDIGIEHSPALFFFGTGVIALWATPLTILTEVVAAVAGIASAFYLRHLLSDLSTSLRGGLRRAMHRPGYFEFGIIGLYLFALFPFAAFPRNPVQAGTILNIYTHFLGFGLGYLVSYITFHWVRLDTQTSAEDAAGHDAD